MQLVSNFNNRYSAWLESPHIARIGECSTLLIQMFLAKHDLPKLNPANEEMSTCFNKWKVENKYCTCNSCARRFPAAL